MSIFFKVFEVGVTKLIIFRGFLLSSLDFCFLLGVNAKTNGVLVCLLCMLAEKLISLFLFISSVCDHQTSTWPLRFCEVCLILLCLARVSFEKLSYCTIL